MNTETKWEAVELDAIRAGDTIRATHTSGSIVIGEALSFDAGAKLLMHGDSHARHYYEHNGWTFERAVPERVLPTEPGWYVSLSSTATVPLTYWIGTLGRWHDSMGGERARSEIPGDLVRLVPVTDVEEAEKRGWARGIREVTDHLTDNLLTGTAGRIRDAFPAAFDEADR